MVKLKLSRAKWKGSLYEREGKGVPKDMKGKETWRDSNTGEVFKDVKRIDGRWKGFGKIGREPRKASPYGRNPLSEKSAREEEKKYKRYGAKESRKVVVVRRRR
jgi:hypothetical protein